MEPVIGPVRQDPGSKDCVPASVAHIMRLLGNPVSYPLPFGFVRTPGGGCTLLEAARVLGSQGYEARYRSRVWIDEVKLPCIAAIRWYKTRSSGHAVVVTRVIRGEHGRTQVHFHDPDTGKTRKWSFRNWYSHFDGRREVVELT